MDTKLVRIDKFISNTGITSRRGIRKFLKNNIVTLNGIRITDPALKCNPLIDKVLIDENQIKPTEFEYYLLNKPIGIVSTTSDEMGRTDVTSFIDTYSKIYPIGRLDKDTHGLLLLTNDGKMTHKLIHPKYHIPKTYIVTTKNKPNKSQLTELSSGVLLDDGITLPAKVSVISLHKNITQLKIVLYEGRNRQIRRMCAKLALDLIDLKRIAFGPIKLGNTPVGKWRKLTKSEVEHLRNLFNIDK